MARNQIPVKYILVYSTFHSENFIINVFIIIFFLFIQRGVRQGHKLNQKNHQENIADHYQSQNEDSSEETHTYEQPCPATAETPMGHEQELTTYDVVL